MDHGAGRPPGPGKDEITRVFVGLRDRLVGTAFFILGDREAARDAVQEAFVKCWRHRHETGSVGSPEAWVFSVVLNAARDLRRRRAVRRAASLPEEDAMPAQRREPGPPEEADRRERLARIRAALLGLPEPEREVFLLRQNGDLSFPAIAGMLGLPLGTVKSRMRLALRRLREALRPRAGAEGRPS